MSPLPPTHIILFELDFNVKVPFLGLLQFLSDLKSTTHRQTVKRDKILHIPWFLQINLQISIRITCNTYLSKSRYVHEYQLYLHLTVKVKLRLFLYFFIKLESFKNSLKASRSNLTFVLNFIDRANIQIQLLTKLYGFLFS